MILGVYSLILLIITRGFHVNLPKVHRYPMFLSEILIYKTNIDPKILNFAKFRYFFILSVFFLAFFYPKVVEELSFEVGLGTY